MGDPKQHTTTTNGSRAFIKLWEKRRRTSSFTIWELQNRRSWSSIPAAERVISAETPIAIVFVRCKFLTAKRSAADYVRLGKMLGDGHHVPWEARHPIRTRARLSSIFLAMRVMSLATKIGGESQRRQATLPDVDKIQFVEMVELDKEGYAEKAKEYDKLFVK
jgi:hypothetical protein